MSILRWLLDWRAQAAGAGTVISLLGWALKRGRLRGLVAHIDRERQHESTMLKLWRAEADLESQARQIDLMDQRIEDLLGRLSDGLSPESRAEMRSRAKRRSLLRIKSPRSNEKSAGSKRT